MSGEEEGTRRVCGERGAEEDEEGEEEGGGEEGGGEEGEERLRLWVEGELVSEVWMGGKGDGELTRSPERVKREGGGFHRRGGG